MHVACVYVYISSKSSCFFSLFFSLGPGPKIELPRNWHRVAFENVDATQIIRICCVNFIKLKSVRRFAIDKQQQKKWKRTFCRVCVYSIDINIIVIVIIGFCLHSSKTYREMPCWAIGHFYLARIFFL